MPPIQNPFKSIDIIALREDYCVVVLGGVVRGKFVVCFEINPILYILEVLLIINKLK